MRSFFKPGEWFRKPHPLLSRNRELFADFDQSRPLTEYRFVVFDTELTGLNRRRDEIISIGAVRIVNLQIDLGATFHRYVRPRNLDHNQATFIHQITPEQLRVAPPIDEVLPNFVEFCGDALLVAHFLAIDMNYLNRAAQDVLGGLLSNPGIDTMRLARAYKEAHLVNGYGHCDQTCSYSLDSLSEEFQLPRFKSHDALEDALQAAYLFLYLVRKLTTAKVRTLKELYQAGRLLRLM
jgi:DNA polymerase-3 subunit epsilon